MKALGIYQSEPVTFRSIPVPSQTPAKDTKKIRNSENVVFPETVARVLETIPDAFYALDNNWRFIYLNKNAEQALKKRRKDIIGKKIWEVFPRSTHGQYHTQYQKAFSTGKVIQFEEFSKRLCKWHSVYVYPVANGLYVYFRNITQRKKVQESMNFLAEAGEVLATSLSYKTTLKNIAELSVPIFADWCSVDMLEPDGTFKQVALAHSDESKIKLLKKIRRKYPPGILPTEGISQVLKTGEPGFYPVVAESVIENAIQDKKYLSIVKKLGLTSVLIVPMRVEGRAIGSITFVCAKSKRHYTKEDLHTAEHLVARASLAIENALLYKKAQDAIKVRDEFISIASHELKTPITSLKVYFHVLSQQFKSRDKSKVKMSFERVNLQIDKLTKLIKTLLDVSRMHVGKLSLEKGFFSLCDLTEEIIDAISQAQKTHKILLTGNAKDNIYGDKERIGQIIINLITNAIKYSPRTKRVIVTLSQDLSATFLSVQDFGIGIDQLDQAKIFERFFQVNTEREKTFPGLGIGLYVSSEIAKRHGGKILVDSIPGKGSKFTLILPRK